MLEPHAWFTPTQCIFGSILPYKFFAMKIIWSLLCGASLMLIWIFRNNKVFSHTQWPQDFVNQALWEALLDVGYAIQMKVGNAA